MHRDWIMFSRLHSEHRRATLPMEAVDGKNFATDDRVLSLKVTNPIFHVFDSQIKERGKDGGFILENSYQNL